MCHPLPRLPTATIRRHERRPPPSAGAYTADAYHITANRPDGRGQAAAMTRAIKRAGLEPKDIDYVAAHATATKVGDIGETTSIKLAFGDHAKDLAISANKSMVGHTLSAAGVGAAGNGRFTAGRATSNRARLNHPDASPAPACAHDQASGAVCATCGHGHAPDPSLLSGERFDWRTAWSAVVAVGIRPCSGALIVLSFAFLNGMWIGGILSVLAMAVGTAITVATLATLAVTAKDWAVLLAGEGRWGGRVHTAIEIGGAALVFFFGLVLLSASLAA